VTPTVEAKEETEDDSDRGSGIITNNIGPLSNGESEYNNYTAEPNEYAYDKDEPTEPPMTNLQDMVERLQKTIDVLFQHNTELVE
jgi:hypothetical protein